MIEYSCTLCHLTFGISEATSQIIISYGSCEFNQTKHSSLFLMNNETPTESWRACPFKLSKNMYQFIELLEDKQGAPPKVSTNACRCFHYNELRMNSTKLISKSGTNQWREAHQADLQVELPRPPILLLQSRKINQDNAFYNSMPRTLLTATS
jgi:hypothetical protein